MTDKWTSDPEKKMEEECENIRKKIKGKPPVIIIVGGTDGGPERTMTASAGVEGNRLRNFLGILEASKQITTLNHLFGREIIKLEKRIEKLESK